MGVRRVGLSGGLGLTALILHLQAHDLVGRRAIHNSFQDPLDQGLLVAWENPKVFSRQIAGAVAALEGELDQQGGSAAEEKREPWVPAAFPGISTLPPPSCWLPPALVTIQGLWQDLPSARDPPSVRVFQRSLATALPSKGPSP